MSDLFQAVGDMVGGTVSGPDPKEAKELAAKALIGSENIDLANVSEEELNVIIQNLTTENIEPYVQEIKQVFREMNASNEDIIEGLRNALSLHETEAKEIYQEKNIYSWRKREADLTAMKIRNLLVKELGGKPVRNVGGNPYLDTQRLEVRLTKKAIKQLPPILIGAGLEETDDKGNLKDYMKVFIAPDNPKLKAVYNPEGDRVWVYGPKKAKRSTLPIYD